MPWEGAVGVDRRVTLEGVRLTLVPDDPAHRERRERVDHAANVLRRFIPLQTESTSEPGGKCFARSAPIAWYGCMKLSLFVFASASPAPRLRFCFFRGK